MEVHPWRSSAFLVVLFAFVALDRDEGVSNREFKRLLQPRPRPRPWLRRALARGAKIVFVANYCSVRRYTYRSDLKHNKFGTLQPINSRTIDLALLMTLTVRVSNPGMPFVSLFLYRISYVQTFSPVVFLLRTSTAGTRTPACPRSPFVLHFFCIYSVCFAWCTPSKRSSSRTRVYLLQKPLGLDFLFPGSRAPGGDWGRMHLTIEGPKKKCFHVYDWRVSRSEQAIPSHEGKQRSMTYHIPRMYVPSTTRHDVFYFSTVATHQ